MDYRLLDRNLGGVYPPKIIDIHPDFVFDAPHIVEILAGQHPDWTLLQNTGVKDSNGNDIYECDVVYIGGYGEYTAEFPFIDLYEAQLENDIGEIRGRDYSKFLNKEK